MMSVNKQAKSPDWVIGYTTIDHLLLDLDDTSYYKTEHLVNILMREYPEIGDCLILRSSTSKLKEIENIYPLTGYKKHIVRDSYHLVFNNLINYDTSCKIIETLASLGVIEEDYTNIRYMWQDMTLRVSPVVGVEKIKPCPVPIYFVINPYSRKRDNGIFRYMQLRNLFNLKD